MRGKLSPVTVRAMTTATISPLVALVDVTKRFPGKAALALDRVSATIPSGQFVAVIGRSGAGKTTLLRSLTGATTISAGYVLVGGVELGGLRGDTLRAHHARVGMIYQQFNLVRRLRVLDNVLIGRLPHLTGWRRVAATVRMFDAAERERALRCLDHVGLLDRVWQRADTLSGGEQQRVAIARLLAQDARVVLADEPVASLDLANGRLVMETLRRIARGAGLTVVATLHHVDYARRYADRVIALKEGRLVFDGPPDALSDAALFEIFGVVPGELPDDAAPAPRAALAAS
jgi:phosphonate transport system ATP-binding protein